MKELDALKKAWKKQDYTEDQVSAKEIYKMLHKKSSSIVKWILIISIIEFALPHIVHLFSDLKSVEETYRQLGLYDFILGTFIFNYLVVVVFIYLFYKNYKSISVDTSSKLLMSNILNTRKTVKYYIAYNLTMVGILYCIVLYRAFSKPENLQKFFHLPVDQNIDEIWLTALLASIGILILFLGLLWLFYRVIYGILLKRLLRNYNELKQLEL